MKMTIINRCECNPGNGNSHYGGWYEEMASGREDRSS
jgi:hypothetical protein